MSQAEIMQLVNAHMWGGALMSMPILVIALIVGFAIGLLQALTSIQELTLTFVPKLLAILIVFFLTSGYMTQILLDLFQNQVLAVAAR